MEQPRMDQLGMDQSCVTQRIPAVTSVSARQLPELGLVG